MNRLRNVPCHPCWNQYLSLAHVCPFDGYASIGNLEHMFPMIVRTAPRLDNTDYTLHLGRSSEAQQHYIVAHVRDLFIADLSRIIEMMQLVHHHAGDVLGGKPLCQRVHEIGEPTDVGTAFL